MPAKHGTYSDPLLPTRALTFVEPADADPNVQRCGEEGQQFPSLPDYATLLTKSWQLCLLSHSK